ncbi:hypothetical protein FISHEDRAFT_71260 [Fistulina hepatica ATCC 64428]|nr:hypothetical protein FISHEDRAFT_71260 [Fistulina hepatica ATCC 64428]
MRPEGAAENGISVFKTYTSSVAMYTFRLRKDLALQAKGLIRSVMIPLQLTASAREVGSPFTKAFAYEYGHWVTTGKEVSFQTVFRLRWENLCQHPATLQVGFGVAFHEYVFTAVATPRYPSATASIHIPLSHARIGVIFHIDDTVKRSDVSVGARTIFRNVLVTDLVETLFSGLLKAPAARNCGGVQEVLDAFWIPSSSSLAIQAIAPT